MKAVTLSVALRRSGVHRQQWQIGLVIHGQNIRDFLALRFFARHLKMERVPLGARAPIFSSETRRCAEEVDMALSACCPAHRNMCVNVAGTFLCKKYYIYMCGVISEAFAPLWPQCQLFGL